MRAVLLITILVVSTVNSAILQKDETPEKENVPALGKTKTNVYILYIMISGV